MERVYRVMLKNACPEEVFRKLLKRFGNVYSGKNEIDDSFFGVLVGEKIFLRTMSDTAIVLVVSGQENTTRIDITSAGGGYGWLKIDYGTHESYMKKVLKTVGKELEMPWERILTPEDELRRRLLDKYTKRLGSDGEWVLEIDIRKYHKKGLIREEAIRKLAKDEGVIN